MDRNSGKKSANCDTSMSSSDKYKTSPRYKRTVVDVPPRENVGPDGSEEQEFK